MGHDTSPWSRPGGLVAASSAPIMLLILMVSSLVHLLASQPLQLVHDILTPGLDGVQVLYAGPRFESFERPLPKLVDPSLLVDFEANFNVTQDFNCVDNLYVDDGSMYVTSIKDAYVSGVMGSVFDAKGRVYTEFTLSSHGVPANMTQLKELEPECKRFKRLVTVVQKYGHMYYHFLLEAIPRLILAQPYMDDGTKVLMFGAMYEAGWLQALGIPLDRVEVYDPEATYCVDELIVPNPSVIITPAKEGFNLIRKAFGAEEPLPKEERNLIIYSSRDRASDREVANEDELLNQLRAQFPGEEVVKFTGEGLSVKQTVRLFQRAKLVLGMHGAGLSHTVFCAPGTPVIEFLFMFDPPMMFWHMSGALGLNYIMLPLANSWWLDPTVDVQPQDVKDAVAIALNQQDSTGCGAGMERNGSGGCKPCPAGTYRTLAGSESCVPCAHGRVAASAGSSFCKICPSGSITEDSRECLLCPDGMNTLFPGSSSPSQCMQWHDILSEMDHMFSKDVLAKKLVGIPMLTAKTAALQRRLHEWSIVRRLHAMQEMRTLAGRQLTMLNDLFNSGTGRHEQPAITSSSSEDGGQGELIGAHGYGVGRRLNAYGEDLGRRLNAYGLHAELRRHLSAYGELRQMGEEQQEVVGDRRLLSYSRRLQQYGRDLARITRQLTSAITPQHQQHSVPVQVALGMVQEVRRRIRSLLGL